MIRPVHSHIIPIVNGLCRLYLPSSVLACIRARGVSIPIPAMNCDSRHCSREFGGAQRIPETSASLQLRCSRWENTIFAWLASTKEDTPVRCFQVPGVNGTA
jgi:hypothetical protein